MATDLQVHQFIAGNVTGIPNRLHVNAWNGQVDPHSIAN